MISRPLRVRLRHRDGEYSSILAPPGTMPSPGVIDDPAVSRRLTQSKGGELELMDRVPVATSYTVDDETFTVRVHSSLPLEDFTPQLSSADLDVPGTLTRRPTVATPSPSPWSARAGGTTA